MFVDALFRCHQRIPLFTVDREDDSRKFTERGEELDRLHKANEALQARITELERVQTNEADAR
jgi:hypothetical protein